MRKYILSVIPLLFGLSLPFSLRGADLTKLPFGPVKDSCTLIKLPGVIEKFYVRDFAVSPDNKEILFTIYSNKNTFSSIVQYVYKGDKWELSLAPFSGKYGDLEPAFSNDGKRLYFVSNRPLSDAGEPKDFDIWYVEKENGNWANPHNLGLPVNTKKDEFYPSIAMNGNLYYTAQYENSKGHEDIFVSKYTNGNYTTPESLSDSVNSSFYEFNAYVAPDESFIIYTSYGREDDLGKRGDLYISFKNEQGEWKQAVNLGNKINSPFLDYCPYVTADKKYFIFTSERSSIQPYYKKAHNFNSFLKAIGTIQNGKGNLYWITTKDLFKLNK